MKTMQHLWSKLRWSIPISSLIVVACLGQTSRQSVVLSSPVDQRTAVSFYWFGDMESHWRDPMNFYVAGANDPRLHTVSLEHGPASKGVETWITAPEMQAMIEKFAQSRLEWLDSKKVEPFKPWQKRDDGHDTFDITVLSAKGTARAGIRLVRMCDQLRELDSVMPTPRLRWQFQTLRWDDGCVIAGYDNEAMPKE